MEEEADREQSPSRQQKSGTRGEGYSDRIDAIDEEPSRGASDADRFGGGNGDGDEGIR